MTSSAIAAVTRQYDAYNARDADACAACFAADCVVADLHGPVVLRGADSLRDRYAEIFARHPANRTTLINRIALGNVVIDHENVRRGPLEASFEIVAIYTVKDDRIARVDFIKKES